MPVGSRRQLYWGQFWRRPLSCRCSEWAFIARTERHCLGSDCSLAGLLLSGSDGNVGLLAGFGLGSSSGAAVAAYSTSEPSCCGGPSEPRDVAYSVSPRRRTEFAGFVAGALQWTAGLSAYLTMTVRAHDRVSALLLVIGLLLLSSGRVARRPPRREDGISIGDLFRARNPIRAVCWSVWPACLRRAKCDRTGNRT